MEDNYITKVISRFFKKQYSARTNARVQQWLIEEEYKEQKTNVLYDVWESTHSEVDREALSALKQVKAGLGLEQTKRKSYLFRLRRLKVASIFLLMLSLSAGVYFFYGWERTIHYATLPGEMKTFYLPDGSKVWLNAKTTISYTDSRKKRMRQVRLSGEVYFEVKADQQRSFIVETDHLSVEVIGTAFNIEAYPEDSRTIATLDRGRIKVEVRETRQTEASYYLQPGQQLIYQPSTGVEIYPVSSGEVKGWQEGNLLFSNTSFEDIINKLERRFNVKIVIHDFENSRDYYSVKFIHGETLLQIMNILQGMAGDFTYEIRE